MITNDEHAVQAVSPAPPGGGLANQHQIPCQQGAQLRSLPCHIRPVHDMFYGLGWGRDGAV